LEFIEMQPRAAETHTVDEAEDAMNGV